MQTVMSIWRKNMVKEWRGWTCALYPCAVTFLSWRACWYSHVFTAKKHIKQYRWNVCPLFLKKHGKQNLPNLTAISLQWTTDALKAIVGKIYGKSSLFCNIFSTKNMVNKKTSKSHCNSLDMTHWMFLKRLWTEFMDRNLCFATFFRPTHGEKTLLNLIAIVWTWPTECFWSDCRING